MGDRDHRQLAGASDAYLGFQRRRARTDGSGSWDVSTTNWYNGSANVAWNNANSDVATIGAANGAAGTITLATGITVGGLTFNPAGSGNYTIAGNTLTLGGNSAPITTNVNATISSALAGSAVLLKQGNAMLTLTGTSSYAGNIYVSAGTLTLGAAGSLTAGSGLTVDGASSIANIAGTFTQTTGNGSVTIQNGGTLNWSGMGTVGGSSIGSIFVGYNSAGTFNTTAGSLLVNYANGDGLGVGWGNGGNGSLNVSGGSVTTSSGSFFVVGYAGNSAVGTATVGSGGTLNLGGGGGMVFIGGGGSGSGQYGTGTLNVNSGGTVNVAAAGGFPNDRIYLAGYGGTGVINLNGGLLSTARQFGNGGASTINFNGGTLQTTIGSADLFTVTNAFVQAGGAVIDTQANNVTIGQLLQHDPGLGSAVDGGLTKLGSGMLQLNANNTYTGPTTISAGTLAASDYNLGPVGTTVTLNGGTLQNTAFIGNSRALALGASGGTVNTNGSSTVFSSTTGSGPLTKTGAGTLTLMGSNSSTAPVALNAGTLNIVNTSALGSGPVTLGGGTLRLAGQFQAQQQMIPLTGYTQDIIWANGESGSVGGGITNMFSGWAWYERGIAGSTQGLPVNSAPPRGRSRAHLPAACSSSSPITAHRRHAILTFCRWARDKAAR